jgi:UDP-glucose 6-dehydrogenase
MLAFFWLDCAYFYMRDLPFPDLFLKVCKRTECFKLKLNAYLAFKITFDKERLPLLPIQFDEF